MQGAVERLTPMGGQMLAGLGRMVGNGWVIPLDDLVEECLFGLVVLVAQARTQGRFARRARSPGAIVDSQADAGGLSRFKEVSCEFALANN